MQAEPNPIDKPTFFILGAGKCGTTTLHGLLGQHPEITMSEVKEPSFFCSYFQVVDNPVRYFELFARQAGERHAGEASHVYFSNPETPPILRALFPGAKFILIFRNPVLRAYSLFQHMKRNELEPAAGFAEGLELEEYRYHSEKFFADCPQYFWNYMYVRSSLYDEQLGRYLEYFPKDQFLFTTLAELRSQPGTLMRRIWEFLEVGEFLPEFQALNVGSYDPIAPELSAELEERFRPSVQRLQEMTGPLPDLMLI